MNSYNEFFDRRCWASELPENVTKCENLNERCQYSWDINPAGTFHAKNLQSQITFERRKMDTNCQRTNYENLGWRIEVITVQNDTKMDKYWSSPRESSREQCVLKETFLRTALSCPTWRIWITHRILCANPETHFIKEIYWRNWAK